MSLASAENESQTSFDGESVVKVKKAKKVKEVKLDEEGNPIVKAIKEPKAPKLDAEGNPIVKVPRVKVDDTHIICLDPAKGNPKRPGTNAHAMFELYKDGMTVAQYIEVGGGRDWVSWDASKGYITLG